MKLRICILTVLACSLATEAGAQPISVDEAVRLGLERNTQVRAVRAEADAADAERRAARASLLPSIEARASYLRPSDNTPEAEYACPGPDTTLTPLPAAPHRHPSETSI